MPLDPTSLLAGPRGRRVCLEHALGARWDGDPAVAEEFRLAVFNAAYDLDPGRGTSRVLIGLGADDTLPVVSASTVAELLDGARFAEPEDNAALFPLVAAVDNARYWQEPDGEDVLADAPELRESLARVAASLAQSAHTNWWTSPMDTAAQWTVTFDEPTPGSADAKPTSETLARWHDAQVREEAAARRDRPADARALWSGTWWSRPPRSLTHSTRAVPGHGPAGLWLVEDKLGWTDATARAIDVPGPPRVYEIDGPESWADLCRRYPLEVTASRKHDWYRATGRDGRWVIPNWAQLHNDVDAVHLSVAGYLSTAGRAIPVTNELSTVLAGWDPDQTYWLRDVRVQDTDPQSWTLQPDQGMWEIASS
jgi:hypothetical protein